MDIDIFVVIDTCTIISNEKPHFSEDMLMRGRQLGTDMEFIQNFTPPDFQAKNFTLSISTSFNSFSQKKHKR